MEAIKKNPSKLIDLATNEERDVWPINFPPFVSNGTPDFQSLTGKVVYWPEFLIRAEDVPSKLFLKRLEDKVFVLKTEDNGIREFVKIQLYWEEKHPGYLIFRPYTLEDNLEIMRRMI